MESQDMVNRCSSDICPEAESVIRYVDLFNRDNLFFIFRDDTRHLHHIICRVCSQLTLEPARLTFARQSELSYLSIPPYCMESFHLSGYLRTRGTVLHGKDARDLIPSPRWTRRRLFYHLEHSADTVRVELLSACVLGKPVLQTVRCAFMDLMASVLSVLGKTIETIGEIPLLFRQVAPVELQKVVEEWESLCGTPPDDGPEDKETRSRRIWIYESFLKGLRHWIEPQQFSSTFTRLAYSQGRLVAARSVQSEPTNLPRGLRLAPRTRGRGTSSHYWDAVEEAMRELMPCRDVMAMLLYGSLAREEVDPGRSDILDGYAILRDQSFTSYSRFVEAFGSLLMSAAKLRRSGLPFSPFKYSLFHDFHAHHLAVLLPEWADDYTSRTILGADLRSYAGTSVAGAHFARYSIFTVPLIMRRYARFLNKNPTNEELQQMQWLIAGSAKCVPRWLCALCDRWVRGKEAFELLPDLFSRFDMSTLNVVRTLRVSSLDARRTLHLFQRVMDTCEGAGAEAAAWLRHRGISILS